MHQAFLVDPGPCLLEQIYGFFQLQTDAHSFEDFETRPVDPVALALRKTREGCAVKNSALSLSLIHPLASLAR